MIIRAGQLQSTWSAAYSAKMQLAHSQPTGDAFRTYLRAEVTCVEAQKLRSFRVYSPDIYACGGRNLLPLGYPGHTHFLKSASERPSPPLRLFIHSTRLKPEDVREQPSLRSTTGTFRMYIRAEVNCIGAQGAHSFRVYSPEVYVSDSRQLRRIADQQPNSAEAQV